MLDKPVLGLLGGLATVSLALAACGGDDDDADVIEDTTTTEAASGEPEEEPEDAGDTPVDGDLTPAGTELAFGETANIPVSSGDAEGVVAAGVVGIEEGDPSDLDPLDMGDQVAGMVPYYLTVSFTKVSGGELQHVSMDSNFDASLPDGSAAQKLTVIGTFDVCDGEAAPADFDEEGVSFESCVVFVAPEATAADGAAYTGEFDGPYNDDPITWSA